MSKEFIYRTNNCHFGQHIYIGKHTHTFSLQLYTTEIGIKLLKDLKHFPHNNIKYNIIADILPNNSYMICILGNRLI